MLTYKDLLFTGPEAVCVLDVKLNIKQHNQLAELLLGYRDKKLTGVNISDILYDDKSNHHLLGLSSNSGWFQGECLLKMDSNLPLAVKFRAGPVMDEILSPTYQKAANIGYHPSETQSSASKKGYVLVFRETSDAQDMDCKRRIQSLCFLLDTVSRLNEKPEDILLGFARVFDQYADVIILPADFSTDKLEEEAQQFLMTPSVIEEALRAKSERVTILHRDDGLWCFSPIYSEDTVYGISCIKFGIPRLYSKEDKRIFSLAGRVLGLYMSSFAPDSRNPPSRSPFRTIIDGIEQPVMVVDRNGVVTLCNSAVQAIYGYAASEMTGKLLRDFVLPADSFIRYEEMLNMAIKGISSHDKEITHLRNDWTTVDICATAYPDKLDNGLIVGAIFILRNLKEKNRLWSKMMQWEKLAALGEILTDVANDLNNPLTSLTGYSQLLLNRKVDEETDNMAATIYKEAERCSNIVRGVLALASGSGEQKEYSHVNDVITAVINLKQHQLKPNNVNISVKLGDNIPGTVTAPYDLERLFLRIINYAEQRMLEYDNGGHITVESAFEDGNIVVRFIDTGICILKNDIAEILDPFFTPDGRDEEIGLGLSISYQILRNMGGSIRVDNEMGKGNTFTVKLPVLKEVSSDFVAQSEEIACDKPKAGKRILVVDDDPSIVEMIAVVLQQMGHNANIARDGNEAMNKLQTEDYDLIITDLRMPSGFTGDRLHKFVEIKDLEMAQQMIFITGDTANPETRDFLQSTSNPYLEKPFMLENLRETIQKLLSKSSGNKKSPNQA